MRKIIFALVILLSIAGGLLKHKEMLVVFGQVSASENYLNMNRCEQELLWLPIGSLFGLLFLLIPQKTIEWFIKPLSVKVKNYVSSNLNYGALRFLGFVLAVPTFLIFPSGPCIDVFQKLFGR